jgi:hypothetical protein
MRSPKTTIARVTVAGAAVLLCLVASAAPVASAEQPFKVASTLDGLKVLPHHVHWYAKPGLPENSIAEVAFVIDGKVRWIEQTAPYIYGDPEDYALPEFDRGYLSPGFLSPGRHEFTVRVTATDGRKAADTVVARVRPAPNPPARLAGKWQRRIDDISGVPGPGSPGNPTKGYVPPGTFTMVIEKRWIQVRQPGHFDPLKSEHTGAGWIYDSDYTAGPKTINVYGAVTFRPFANEAEGGPWCYWGGPPAVYTWSVSGKTLTLKPAGGKDRCGLRQFVWAGEWTRAG